MIKSRNPDKNIKSIPSLDSISKTNKVDSGSSHLETSYSFSSKNETESYFIVSSNINPSNNKIGYRENEGINEDFSTSYQIQSRPVRRMFR
jgi:hypothetical protein